MFLSGALLGVAITIAALYLRPPLMNYLAGRALTHRHSNKSKATAVTLPLRNNEAVLGSDTAAATLVEFSDFQCHYCALFRTKLFPEIKAQFIDTGKLRFVQRHLPLSMHKHARLAAHAAACAGDQGRYWDLGDIMFSRGSCLDCLGVVELSKALALDRKAFESCMSSNAHMPEIEQDVQAAERLGINATPSFVLGRTAGGAVEGIVLAGVRPLAQFRAEINRVLSDVSTRVP
jgi:protein-disulfide isomerase